ncbi:MAG: hypothetical protein IH897_16275, partial [Planctomycetes bacterium]|nr:hypothetical protein [Planctomycetota bacterium]
HPNLVEKALESVRVVGHIPRQKLESHRLTQFQILSSIDLAHSAFAEQADDPVPLGQHGARREAGIIKRVGGRPTAMTGQGWIGYGGWWDCDRRAVWFAIQGVPAMRTNAGLIRDVTIT